MTLGRAVARRGGAGPWLGAALLLLACGPAEPPTPPLPPLHVEVEVDLEQLPPVDEARLAAIEPDLEDAERRAWDIGPLIGEKYYEAGARLDVIDSGRTSVSFAEPSRRQDGRRPALVLNQKGEWFFQLLESEEDRAHGRGGNRGRTQAGRVRDVARLRVFTPSGGASRRRPEAEAEVTVVARGEPIARWTPETLADTPPLPVEGRSRRLQGAWGLREAVGTLPGPAWRVVRLHDTGGRATDLDPAVWDDADRIPVLRLNQRGLIKLEWVDGSGRRAQGPEVRGLSKIELEEAAS